MGDLPDIISVPNVLEFVGRNTLAVIGYIDSHLFTDYLDKREGNEIALSKSIADIIRVLFIKNKVITLIYNLI